MTFPSDRIYGAILGAAIGDAIGSTTRGRPPKSIAADKIGMGKLTSHTQQMITVMRAAQNYDDSPFLSFLANKMSETYKRGFPEIKEEGACDLFTKGVIEHRDFTATPLEVATATKGIRWNNMAMTRVIPIAFLENPQNWAENVTVVTHTDTNCVFGAIFIAELISRIAGNRDISPEAAIDALAVARKAVPNMNKKLYQNTVKMLMKTNNLADIVAISDRDAQMMPQTTMQVAFWAFRILLRGGVTSEDFEKHIKDIAKCGGTADVNCAIFGAVIGASVGYNTLPAGLLTDLPHVRWLLGEVEKFMSIVQVGEFAEPTEEKKSAIEEQTMEEGPPAVEQAQNGNEQNVAGHPSGNAEIVIDIAT